METIPTGAMAIDGSAGAYRRNGAASKNWRSLGSGSGTHDKRDEIMRCANRINRPHFVKALGLSSVFTTSIVRQTFATRGSKNSERQGGISLNYDNSHFFCWHPKEEMNASGVDAWVDQFAGSQVDANGAVS